MHDGFGAWSPSNRVAKADLLFETGEFPKKSEQMRFYGHGLHLFRFDQHASFASGFFDLRFTIYARFMGPETSRFQRPFVSQELGVNRIS